MKQVLWAAEPYKSFLISFWGRGKRGIVEGKDDRLHLPAGNKASYKGKWHTMNNYMQFEAKRHIKSLGLVRNFGCHKILIQNASGKQDEFTLVFNIFSFTNLLSLNSRSNRNFFLLLCRNSSILHNECQQKKKVIAKLHRENVKTPKPQHNSNKQGI